MTAVYVKFVKYAMYVKTKTAASLSAFSASWRRNRPQSAAAERLLVRASAALQPQRNGSAAGSVNKRQRSAATPLNASR